MCTYCGHVSRRPVLDVPSGTHVAGIPAHLAQAGSVHSAATGMFSSRAGEGRGSTWVGRTWPYRMNPPLVVGFNRGWTNSGTPFGGGGGTGGPYGSWPSYWGDGCGVCGVGSYGGGGLFGKDKCRWDSVLFSLFRVVSVVFVSLRWLWQKVWRDERVQEDPLSGSGRGSQRRGEDASGKEGSRGEKARRKAEEKRQARMEREQLEAEERRQREEVARLVEERRRLRDEKMEAERESEREAAAEREREIRREREAERRRQEKLKEKERDLIKERTSRDAEDSEDSKTDIKKMRDSKGKDSEKKTVEVEKKMDGMKPVPGQTNSGDPVKKIGKALRADLSGKAGEVKMAGALKSQSGGVKGSVAANSKAHITNSTSFSGVGTTTGPKPLKGVSSPVSALPPAPVPPVTEVTNGEHSHTTCSAWNRMPWTKVWGKGFSAPVEEKSVNSSELLPNSIVSKLDSSSDGVERGSWAARNYCTDGIKHSDVLPPLVQAKLKNCWSLSFGNVCW